MSTHKYAVILIGDDWSETRYYRSVDDLQAKICALLALSAEPKAHVAIVRRSDFAVICTIIKREDE